MNYLSNFTTILCGHFDNAEQIKELNVQGVYDFPFAEHINTLCNDKILDLPTDFKGIFVLEESYYTVQGRTNAMPHLFLFTQEQDIIKLTSYEIPAGYDKSTFTYKNLSNISFKDLRISKKFTPALYTLKNSVWEGGSESMFSPTLKFKLFERISIEKLEVWESMELNGKRTFGFDQPIIYKRK